jgi:CheY-like chemotaxis protein
MAVESEPGNGAVFRVLLPIASEANPRGPTPSPPQPAVCARVLAIDDDAMLLRSLTRILGRDFDVVTAASAREGIERLGKEEFDVILCDLMMPEMTGMELHAVLATASPETAERMIFLTGGTFTPRAQSFLDAVPNLRLEKPFDPRQLRAIIRDRAEGCRRKA